MPCNTICHDAPCSRKLSHVQTTLPGLHLFSRHFSVALNIGASLRPAGVVLPLLSDRTFEVGTINAAPGNRYALLA